MTTADDALFEPFSGPIKKVATGIIASGIMKRPDATAIDIITANPKSLYTDAAVEVMDHAAKLHPQMFDIRLPVMHQPIGFKFPGGAFRLDTLVERFHDGNAEFWVACPGLTPPKQFQFAGRFGHFKVWRFTQQLVSTQVAQFVAEWFWVDSTEGQLSAVELGVLVIHPKLRLHHVFGNRNDAQSYYTT
jgi:hypothetical protein